MTDIEHNHALLDAVRSLTPHQKRILFLLTRGYQNKVIAASLGVTESSIKSHMTRILDALSSTNRTQAALVAFSLQNELNVDDIVGRRRVPPDTHCLTDQQLDSSFVTEDRPVRLRHRYGSGASTC